MTNVLWTEERKEYFGPAWQSNVPWGEIIVALNAMDGLPFTKKQQLADRAKRIHIRRPPHIKKAKPVREVERKPPRMPLPRHAPVFVREPGPTKPPVKAPLRIIYNHGFQLWQHGYLPIDKRLDIEAINRAIRRAMPGHPGFQLVTKWFGA